MAIVLIVDDNETNLTLFRHLLKKMDNVESIGFADPIEAISWATTHEPDLVLLDYLMPGMDGFEFIRQFRCIADYKNIPVVMITADTENEIRHRALEIGAYDFLNKPIDKNELLARARNLLALRRTQRALTNHAELLTLEIEKAIADITAREREVVLRLSKAAEHRDPETGQHLIRMSNYSRLIARELNLSEREQKLILEAAPMHDIGKVATPDAILLKRGRLTSAEFEIMKQHAETGYNILCNSESELIRVAAITALSHHEKYDGSGYPKGLKGDDIPIYGRIVAVADVFDALASARPYKKAWSLNAASQYLKDHAGSHFDPKCVNAFFEAWDDVLEIYDRYQEDSMFEAELI
jgi:putative two-component system response regulator